MRNFKIFSTLLLLAVLFSTACKKKGTDRSILTGSEIAPVLTVTPQDSIVLSMDSADIKAVGMKWTAADWGFPTYIRYDVQIVKKGADWTTAKVFHMNTTRMAELSHFDLNDIANSFGIAAEQTGVLSSRIAAFIPGTTQMIYSNVLDRTVTAYKMVKPAITAMPSADSITLTKDSANVAAMSLSWNPVIWAYPVTTEYEVHIIKKGDNWANAMVVSTGTSTSYSITHKKLNQLLLGDFGTDTLGAESLEYRVKASQPGTARMAMSDAITKTFTTYAMVYEVAKLYIPGDYQGWSPSSAQVLEETSAGSSKFSGIVEKTKTDGSLSSGDFKMTPQPNWDYDFGDNGSSYSDPNAGGGNIGPKSNGTNGTNFKLTDGTYLLNVDTIANTWTYALVNWGLIGDATPGGWGSDQNMRYNQTTKLYEITLNLNAGNIKLRKNDDWGVNRGNPTGNDGDIAPLGTTIVGAQNGKNWGVIAGNYTITYDPATEEVVITKN
jgi:hypothetical protein